MSHPLEVLSTPVNIYSLDKFELQHQWILDYTGGLSYFGHE